jgi:hypothetical protein
MRRALVGTALTVIAVLAVAQPASAAPAAPANLGSPTISTDSSAAASWVADPVSTSSGSIVKSWSVQFDASSVPDGSVLNLSSCVDFYDSSMNFRKETCTSGQITSGFTYTLDTVGLTHASVRASGIPAQTCSTDANFQPIGQCKPAAPMSVNATWAGQGPRTYTTFTQYTPGVYRLVSRTTSRNAGASATFNHKSIAGQVEFAGFSYTINKEWGNPCGAASPQGGATQSSSVHPDGC